MLRSFGKPASCQRNIDKMVVESNKILDRRSHHGQYLIEREMGEKESRSEEVINVSH